MLKWISKNISDCINNKRGDKIHDFRASYVCNNTVYVCKMRQ